MKLNTAPQQCPSTTRRTACTSSSLPSGSGGRAKITVLALRLARAAQAARSGVASPTRIAARDSPALPELRRRS